MPAIRVKYTVRPEFAARNRENIAAVMQQLRDKGECGVKYASFVAPDGQTFRHVLLYRDDEAKRVVPSLPAFATFQAELKQELEAPPQSEDWELVGANYGA